MTELNGAHLSLYWAIPFLGVLLSLAFFPLVAPAFWHRHYGKIILAWSSLFLIPSSLLNLSETLSSVTHILGTEYIPFVLLIGALFVVTSGIRIQARWAGNPLSNVGVLFLGTLLSSWIGTTGASMLLVHPLIRANAWRRSQAHVFIFFIFLVANIGGALSPLGDPPLFIGFLEGVPFFWPLQNLMGPTLFVVSAVLLIFFIIDMIFFKKEDLSPPSLSPVPLLKLNGKINFLFLGLIVFSVWGSGSLKTGVVFQVCGVPLTLENCLRDGFLLLISVLSLKLTRKKVREDNHFTWEPLREVAKVFFGIFITVLPVLAMLRAGEQGAFKAIVSAVNHNGVPYNAAYFWLSGLFSSFLDNAPTYLVFFFTAGGDAGTLTTTLSKTLAAISLGSVYFGALTYIGNAPNFMVRSIVSHYGIKMPSFLVYTGIACLILLPIFLISVCIYL
ncbi:MAG: sodium:proton antiporter [Alphaproteobacteria bacterium RIFCSPHIGHO2_01_FULL_41_14]|nr:MAG: sodium:proton antiporter [Alphaproteobacteria bacterium GWA1_45_9]OFW89880.1 MAG: sodium:proton antiporter [Alphaproteobacteria bacterium RIFCSPHIGHO2_01_FULL_41_14]HCI49052.1 sodium:proton antiporter [Holosporales bacterium]